MAAAFVLGEVTAKAGKPISIAVWICVAAGCLTVLWFSACRGNKQDNRTIGMIPLLWGLGTILAIHAAKAPPLDDRGETRTENCQVQGVVYWKEPSGETWRVYIRKSAVLLPGEAAPRQCRNLILYVEEADSIQIGSEIQAEGTVGSFSRATNPGQFDARQYYRAKKIDYPVFVTGEIRVQKASREYAAIWLMEQRLALLQSLERICPEETVGIFQAVFLGEKSEMEEEIRLLYQANGISHILAISGLHLSFLGKWVYQLLRKMTGSNRWAMAGGVVILASYGWMTGSTVSAMRALWMFFALMGAQCAGRSYDMLSAAGMSAIVVLVQYPLQLYEAGFLLTYGAILGIGAVAPCLETIFMPKTKAAKSFLCGLAVQAATLPILLWFFYTYPIYSTILNLFVIPFSGILLFSALAGSVAGLWRTRIGMFFVGSGQMVLEYYEWLCRFAQTLPHGKDVVGRPAIGQILLYYGLLCAALLLGTHFGGENGFDIWRRKKKALWETAAGTAGKSGAAALFFLILYALLRPIPDGMLSITFLDVDQGDCIWIQMPDGTNVLIDGGSTGVKNAGANRILPCLLSRGVETLSQVIVTHPDEDHMNGICELLRDGTIEVGSLYVPDLGEENIEFSELFSLAEEKKIPVVFACGGDVWGWSRKSLQTGEDALGEDFLEPVLECLHPRQGYRGADANASSVVVRIRYGHFSALLMGDAEIAQESLLEDLKAVTCLKAGHHGSRNSSGESFLRKTTPAVTVISCGAKNRYGHPHEETLARLQEIQSRVLQTRHQGAIWIKTDGIRFWVHTYVGKAEEDESSESGYQNEAVSPDLSSLWQ